MSDGAFGAHKIYFWGPGNYIHGGNKQNNYFIKSPTLFLVYKKCNLYLFSKITIWWILN